jgi:lipoprotein-anchoring transpeptidase ErfK/SrfK
MPKKNKPLPKRHKKVKNRSLVISLFAVGVFLLTIGVSVFLQKSGQPFCANSISCIKDLSGKKEVTNNGVFMGRKVASPNTPDTPTFAISQAKAVLGHSTGDKHIYVDLSTQRLYAYEGNALVYNFPVSTGKWNHTPTGDFRIWIWLRYTRMSGGSQALGTYYNLPNVPYTMFYWNSTTPKSWGYSLHGAYWHDNFGQPMSHGCVNMKIEEAGKIFYWSHPNPGSISYATAEVPGPLITVYGNTPKVE